jgi:hypothetical protein
VELTRLDEEPVETVYSPSKAFRAAITVDSRGAYRIHLELWDTDGWPLGEAAHWCACNRGATFVDTLERARTLAQERLALAEPPEPE